MKLTIFPRAVVLVMAMLFALVCNAQAYQYQPKVDAVFQQQNCLRLSIDGSTVIRGDSFEALRLKTVIRGDSFEARFNPGRNNPSFTSSVYTSRNYTLTARPADRFVPPDRLPAFKSNPILIRAQPFTVLKR